MSDEYVSGIRYETADGQRKYRYPGRKKGYPGVTTVIGSAWPSGYLEDWRIGNIAVQCVANADFLRKKLKRIAQKPEKYRALHIPAIKELLIGWKDDYSAANRGTRIHRGVEVLLGEYWTGSTTADLNGILNLDKDITQDLSPDELASVDMAIAALDRLGVEVEYVEVPVYNHDPKYAGTADIIGTFQRTIRGKRRTVRAVIDLKTGRRISKAYIPQLAAYAKAAELLDGEELKPMPDIGMALVLHVRPDSAQYYAIDIPKGWADFLACHRIYTSSTSTKGMTLYG